MNSSTDSKSTKHDPLIDLALLELNMSKADVNMGSCPQLCEKMYEFAHSDGHALVAASALPCECKLNSGFK